MKNVLLYIACWAMTATALLAQKKPEILAFEGKKKVAKGAENTLSWKVKNAEQVFLQNDITQEKSEVKAEGNYSFKVEKDFSFTLVATRGAQQTTRTFAGKVLKRVPIIHTFGGTDSYYIGTAKLPFLHWEVSGAKYVLLDDSEPIFATDTTFNVNLQESHRFTLRAIGEEGDTVLAQHQIRANATIASYGVVDGTGMRGLVAGMENKIAWDFAGSSWVRLKGKSDTLRSKGFVLVKPDSSMHEFSCTFLVKYANQENPVAYTYNDYVSTQKISFASSSLTAVPEKNITLSWATKGLKNIHLLVNDEVFENREPSGNHSFVFEGETTATLEGTDQYGKLTYRSWTIRNAKRPFIRNTISLADLRQEKQKRKIMMDIFDLDKSNFPKEIKMKVIVADSLGNYVRGLAPPDLSEVGAKEFFKEIIEASEAGKSNIITNFKVREVFESQSAPYDIALALDYSGSMGHYIPFLNEATANLLNGKYDVDRFSIVRFSSNLLTDVRVSQNRDDLVKIWNTRKPISLDATALYAGADEALCTFDSISTNQKVLFLLTDGQENSSFGIKGRAYTAQKIAEKARKMGVKVFPITIGMGADAKLLKDLAWLTGGSVSQCYEPKDIAGAYTELTRSLKHYYEITYTPKQKDEGKYSVILSYNPNNSKKPKAAEGAFFVGEKFTIRDKQGYISLKNKKLLEGRQTIVPKQAVAFFDFDADNLQPRFTAALDRIAEFLKENPNAKADILGHTDLKGTPEKNMELSKRRAEAIFAYLVGKGIEKSRLVVKPLGMSAPVWKAEKEAWQAQENRRIEVEVWE